MGGVARGETVVPLRGQGGRIIWLRHALSYFLVAWSEKVFASAAGRVHRVRCLRRDDVTFFADETLPPLP